MGNKKGYIYIMANDRPTLYTGVTSDLIRRVQEHKNHRGCYFTKKYSLTKLIYYESFDTITQAIIREKQIKDLDRVDKINLVKSINPTFCDLWDSVILDKPG